MLCVDVPYLEPLLFHLRNDEVLKKTFTEHSFFMPHSNIITATEEAIRKNCPSPRALWILPQDTIAANQSRTCKPIGIHTFHIEIITHCIRDQFQISKNDNGLYLSGEYMELSKIRKQVKESVFYFAQESNNQMIKRSFENIVWVKDQMLYPNQDTKWLASALEYKVTIL